MPRQVTLFTGQWADLPLTELAAKAAAALEDRSYVTPDDVKSITLPLLEHRILLTPAAEVEGIGAAEVLRGITDGVAIPR